MNKMNEVAKLLGLKIGEEFKIKGISGTYIITENGLVNKGSEYIQGLVLTQLIVGQLEIQRYPWKPNNGEKYFYIVFDCDFSIFPEYWENTYEENINYKIGNCYRTYHDAEASISKWKDFFKNDKVFTYA